MIENGGKGIEHGNLLDGETAELMAERVVTSSPLLRIFTTLAIFSEGRNVKVVYYVVIALRLISSREILALSCESCESCEFRDASSPEHAF